MCSKRTGVRELLQAPHGQSQLTDDRVVSTCSTSHASLAADVARETGVYNHILVVGISIRIQSGENKELFLAIDTPQYSSQL